MDDVAERVYTSIHLVARLFLKFNYQAVFDALEVIKQVKSPADLEDAISKIKEIGDSLTSEKQDYAINTVMKILQFKLGIHIDSNDICDEYIEYRDILFERCKFLTNQFMHEALDFYEKKYDSKARKLYTKALK